MESKHERRSQNKEKVDRSRRHALVASVAAAGAAGLPSEWKRPVVDSILLPAHAQTSVTGTSSFTTQITTSFTTIADIICEIVTNGDQSVSTETFSSGISVWSLTQTVTLVTDCSDGFGGQSSAGTATNPNTSSGSFSTIGDVPTVGTFSQVSGTFPGGTTTVSVTSNITTTSSA